MKKNLSKLANAVLPSSIYRSLSWQKTHARSIQRHKHFSLTPQDVELKHIAGCELLLSREDLLERMPKGLTCAEVGVAQGDFSRQIIDRMCPAQLYLIDAWQEADGRYGHARRQVETELRAEIASGQVALRPGWSWDELEKLADASLDWVYIDAAHDYDSVRRDLAAANGKVRAGGWICGHDYTLWSSKGINRWGVVEAVNEFCRQYGWRFAFLTHEAHRHVSFALRRIDAPG